MANRIEKDVKMTLLRRLIQQQKLLASETDEAEALLNALSYVSKVVPERHVWLEMGTDGIWLDLEDWGLEDEWDNAVARVCVSSEDQLIEVMQAWLSGAPLLELDLDTQKQIVTA